MFICSSWGDRFHIPLLQNRYAFFFFLFYCFHFSFLRICRPKEKLSFDEGERNIFIYLILLLLLLSPIPSLVIGLRVWQCRDWRPPSYSPPQAIDRLGIAVLKKRGMADEKCRRLSFSVWHLEVCSVCRSCVLWFSDFCRVVWEFSMQKISEIVADGRASVM